MQKDSTKTLNIIGQQYDRSNYEFLLFIGDENGCLCVKNCIGFNYHYDVIRYLVKNEFVRKIGKKYVLLKKEGFEPIFMIGSCQSIDIVYSGAILPKQNGVDASYITFWYKKGIDLGNLSKILVSYVKKIYNGPYFIETAPRDEDEPIVRFSV